MPTAFAELPLPVHACIVDFLSIASIFSLSLTCRTLRNILSPYPLEFTLIKSSLFDRSLWQQLGNNHSLAAHVRHLAVLDEQVQMSQSNHPTRVPNPQYFGTNNTLDDGVIAEDALVRALPAMKHLERFEVHSFTNTLLLSEKFWTTLMALRPTPPAIHIYENVDIEDSSCPPGLAASEVSAVFAKFLACQTTISLVLPGSGLAPSPWLERIPLDPRDLGDTHATN
jgi:hypothetical protein